MKRNLIILLLSATMLLTACGGNEAQEIESAVSTETTITTESSTQETMVTEITTLESAIQSEIDNIAGQYEQQETTDSLSAVCEQLASLGLVSEEPTEMAGDMIGAISGVKYSDSKVEIYEYDTTSAKYKEIVETGKTTIEGFGIEFAMTAVNGPYALYCAEAANKDQLVEAFSKLIIE